MDDGRELMDELSQRKRVLLEEFLSCGKVQVYVDSTIEGVTLPADLMSQPQVVNHLSYEYSNEVFIIDELGVTVSLNHDDVRMICTLPWSCLYFLQSLADKSRGPNVGEVFIESLPHALLEQYGLTMRILTDEPVDDIPISRPIHTSPKVEKPIRFTRSPHRLDRGKKELESRASQDILDDQDDSDDNQKSLFSWVQGLEKIDDYINQSSEESGTQRQEQPSKTTPYEPSISYLLEEVVALAEEVRTQGKKQGQGHKSSSKRSALKMGREQNQQEGEHAPERGIFSLAKLKRDLDPS